MHAPAWSPTHAYFLYLISFLFVLLCFPLCLDVGIIEFFSIPVYSPLKPVSIPDWEEAGLTSIDPYRLTSNTGLTFSHRAGLNGVLVTKFNQTVTKETLMWTVVAYTEETPGAPRQMSKTMFSTSKLFQKLHCGAIKQTFVSLPIAEADWLWNCVNV